jgi:hypothetical protein
VAGPALVTALGLELHDAQLRSPLVPDDPRRDRNAREAVAVDDLRAVHVEQGAELHRRPRGIGQALDEQRLPLLDAVLLAARSDDCV